jgi:hypothetical protein
VIEILLALILVDGQRTITSKARTFVVLQLVTNVALIEYLTLQIGKLTKAVVLNSFPHGRFWQFVYTENVRCTRLMQRSLQVVIQQKFVLDFFIVQNS